MKSTCLTTSSLETIRATLTLEMLDTTPANTPCMKVQRVHAKAVDKAPRRSLTARRPFINLNSASYEED